MFKFTRRGALSPKIKALLDYLSSHDEDEQARLDFIEIWTDVPREEEDDDSE